MMKSTILIVTLAISCCTAFQGNAQSAKQLNEQLLRSLDSAKLEYVQQREEYRTEFGKLDQLKRDYRLTQVNNDRLIRKDVFNAMTQFDLAYRALESLGDNPSQLSDPKKLGAIKPKAVELPQSEELKAALTRSVIFKVVPDTLHLDDLKAKKQNPLIQRQLELYKTAKVLNLRQLERINGDYKLVSAAKEQEDSLYAANQNALTLIKAETAKVKARENELVAAYLAKKGKGFPAVYTELYGHRLELQNRLQDGITQPGGDFEEVDPEPEIMREPEREMPPEILEVVDVDASFPGGMEKLRVYLEQNLKYPTVAEEMGISGKCYVKFVVSATGSISNVKVVKGVRDCPECDAEAVRVVKAMPNWIPGQVRGKPVNSFYNLPIPFKPE